MGGHISVISQPDRGSTFSAGLPIHKIKEPISRGEPGHGKVLVIDDRDTWRRFAVAALESNGFKVTTTDKNYGAGNYHHYDLILIDDILARGDSFEIMQSIKAAGAIAKTIVVSSNPRVERTNARKLLGIRDLLPKPYTRADLLRDVKSALSAIRGKA